MFSPTDFCLTVHRARNLLAKGKNGNDAYATMEFGSEKYATNVVEKTLSPSWHQECQFPLPQGGVLDRALVTVSIYNKNHGKLGLQNDDFIGMVKIALSALDTTSQKEYKRWYSLEHKNPKKEKKDRGEVEVGVRFLSKERSSVLPTKMERKNFSNISLKLGSKLRRRSEDEDSGVGSESSTLGRGASMENLHRTPSSVSDSGLKRFSLSAGHGVLSSRGLSKFSNKIGLGGHKTKSTSVEELRAPEMRQVSSSSNLRRSASSGKDDSGNNSLAASDENLAGSSEDVGQRETENTNDLHAPHNDNFSNSKPPLKHRKSSRRETKLSPLSISYKPKSYYRLDVKELCKVSPIPEDPSVTYQHMNRLELLELCMNQRQAIAVKNEQIRELGNYVDNLLVKVMVCTPQILDKSPKAQKTQF